ncbi:hypothetical protein BKA62DRAFT_803163 [Auriculariales sp. MPI-PUGE-AT-0066]|nr:hypothetical protein BKA62DRAFT_803163 [Auriculariales sp. MPI-PUGE-AT-0066]
MLLPLITSPRAMATLALVPKNTQPSPIPNDVDLFSDPLESEDYDSLFEDSGLDEHEDLDSLFGDSQRVKSDSPFASEPDEFTTFTYYRAPEDEEPMSADWPFNWMDSYCPSPAPKFQTPADWSEVAPMAGAALLFPETQHAIGLGFFVESTNCSTLVTATFPDAAEVKSSSSRKRSRSVGSNDVYFYLDEQRTTQANET